MESEREFENSKVKDRMVRGSQSKFYWATEIPTTQHQLDAYKAIEGATVIEIGCSDGRDAAEYTKHCEAYVGIDISDEAVAVATSRMLSNAKFICVDAHVLPFEDAEFDFVIVNSLLHHLDLKVAFFEISRILKANGSLIYREPLGTNPFFQLYRHITPGARTVDERPFSFSDLELMEQYFKLDKVNWFGFFSIISAFIQVDGVRSFLTKADVLMSKTPLRYLFWQFSGVAEKK